MSPPSVPKLRQPRLNKHKDQLSEIPQPNQSITFGSLKLVHAPLLSDDDSDDGAAFENSDVPAKSGTRFDPEASLSLPSNRELQFSFDEVKRCINDVLGQDDSTDFATTVRRLRELVDNFVRLSSFLQTGNKDLEDAAANRLQVQLFANLCNVLLDQWETNASFLLELAPSLFALYDATTGISDDDDMANSAHLVRLGKTLFGLSKDNNNDYHFCNVRYVEAILHAISSTGDDFTLSQADAHSIDTTDASTFLTEQPRIPMKVLIYVAGTIKNMSNSEGKMAYLLATNRAIAILSKTLLWRAVDAAQNKEISQFLVQTTGILRNLSVVRNNLKQFLESHIPLRLCRMIPAFIAHPELTVNVSRILSKLTLHELPRAQINQHSINVQNLMTLIDSRYNLWIALGNQNVSSKRFQDLLFVRVFFVLGNLCASNDQNRRLVANNGALTILGILQFYTVRYSEEYNSVIIDEQDNRHFAAEAMQAMEVLLKLMRVLANLAINADAGTELNGHESLESLLVILKVSLQAGHEELMLNTVSCITNVSYYTSTRIGESNLTKSPRHYSFIEKNRVAIVKLLSRILLDRNEEAVVEAARALGNLSRYQDVLEHMDEYKVLECLVVLLDHSCREVVYTVCGVLMNAALNFHTRENLLSVRPLIDNDCTDIRSLLAGIIESAKIDDIDMTLIASKVLCNLLLSKGEKTVSSDCDVNFVSNANNLRQIIDSILESLNTTPPAEEERRCMLHQSEKDLSLRQELRLVLERLLKSIDFVIDAI